MKQQNDRKSQFSFFYYILVFTFAVNQIAFAAPLFNNENCLSPASIFSSSKDKKEESSSDFLFEYASANSKLLKGSSLSPLVERGRFASSVETGEKSLTVINEQIQAYRTLIKFVKEAEKNGDKKAAETLRNPSILISPFIDSEKRNIIYAYDTKRLDRPGKVLIHPDYISSVSDYKDLILSLSEGLKYKNKHEEMIRSFLMKGKTFRESDIYQLDYLNLVKVFPPVKRLLSLFTKFTGRKSVSRGPSALFDDPKLLKVDELTTLFIHQLSEVLSIDISRSDERKKMEKILDSFLSYRWGDKGRSVSYDIKIDEGKLILIPVKKDEKVETIDLSGYPFLRYMFDLKGENHLSHTGLICDYAFEEYAKIKESLETRRSDILNFCYPKKLGDQFSAFQEFIKNKYEEIMAYSAFHSGMIIEEMPQPNSDKEMITSFEEKDFKKRVKKAIAKVTKDYTRYGTMDDGVAKKMQRLIKIMYQEVLNGYYPETFSSPDHVEIIELLREFQTEEPVLLSHIFADYFHFRVQEIGRNSKEYSDVFEDEEGSVIFGSQNYLMELLANLRAYGDSAHNMVLDHIRAFLEDKPDGKKIKLLIIGTGSGRMAREINEEFPGRIEIIESDPEVGNIARNFFYNNNNNIDIQSLPLNAANLSMIPDGSMDMVISFGAMRYYNDLVGNQAAREMKRVLSDDGLALYGDVPKENNFARLLTSFKSKVDRLGISNELIRGQEMVTRNTSLYNLVKQFFTKTERGTYEKSFQDPIYLSLFQDAIAAMAKKNESDGISEDQKYIETIFSLSGLKEGFIQILMSSKNPKTRIMNRIKTYRHLISRYSDKAQMTDFKKNYIVEYLISLSVTLFTEQDQDVIDLASGVLKDYLPIFEDKSMLDLKKDFLKAIVSYLQSSLKQADPLTLKKIYIDQLTEAPLDLFEWISDIREVFIQPDESDNPGLVARGKLQSTVLDVVSGLNRKGVVSNNEAALFLKEAVYLVSGSREKEIQKDLLRLPAVNYLFTQLNLSDLPLEGNILLYSDRLRGDYLRMQEANRSLISSLIEDSPISVFMSLIFKGNLPSSSIQQLLEALRAIDGIPDAKILRIEAYYNRVMNMIETIQNSQLSEATRLSALQTFRNEVLNPDYFRLQSIEELISTPAGKEWLQDQISTVMKVEYPSGESYKVIANELQENHSFTPYYFAEFADFFPELPFRIALFYGAGSQGIFNSLNKMFIKLASDTSLPQNVSIFAQWFLNNQSIFRRGEIPQIPSDMSLKDFELAINHAGKRVRQQYEGEFKKLANEVYNFHFSEFIKHFLHDHLNINGFLFQKKTEQFIFKSEIKDIAA